MSCRLLAFSAVTALFLYCSVAHGAYAQSDDTGGTGLTSLTGTAITPSCAAQTDVAALRAQLRSYKEAYFCMHKFASHPKKSFPTGVAVNGQNALVYAWEQCGMAALTANGGSTIHPGGSDCTPGTPGYNPNAIDCEPPSNTDNGGKIYPGGSDCTPGTPGFNPNAIDCGAPEPSPQ